MTLLWAVSILAIFAIAGAVIRIFTEITRHRPESPGEEPENSLPGRVLPPGVPLVLALKEAEVARRALQPRDPSAPWVGRPSSMAGGFGPVQCLRRRVGGGLLEFLGPSARTGSSWVRSAGVSDPNALVLIPNEDLEVALPRKGEKWRFDNCEANHLHPDALADLTKSGGFGYDEEGTLFTAKTDWSPGPGTLAWLECGCLRPLSMEKADRSGA